MIHDQGTGVRTLVAIVRELRERGSIDPQRVYGVGYSMGAIGLWDILVRHPDLSSAAVLVAGDLDLAHSAALASVSLWAIVGGRDEVVPPDNTRAFARLVGDGVQAETLTSTCVTDLRARERCRARVFATPILRGTRSTRLT